MTETVYQAKSGPGRPKKYSTDEERRLAYNEQVKACMSRNPFYCNVCDHRYHMASKSKHLRTTKHIKNLNINNYLKR